jgi:predicted amidophosphoribosyltransferase
VHWLKFNGVRSCAEFLAALVADKLTVIAPLPLLRRDALLVPIPLHHRRQRERGFNHSDDIARWLSRITGIPVAAALVRTRSPGRRKSCRLACDLITCQEPLWYVMKKEFAKLCAIGAGSY